MKKNSIKPIVGFLMILTGIFLGFYVGLWVCFISGIWTILQMMLGNMTLAFGVFAWAFVKIMLAGLFGFLAALFLIIPGAALLD